MPADRPPSEFFVFDLAPPSGGPAAPNDVVLFTGRAELRPASAIEAMRRHLERKPSPGRVLVMGSRAADKQVIALAEDADVQAHLPSFTQWVNTPRVVPLCFEADGQIRDARAPASGVVDAGFRSRLLRTGVLDIFDRHGGVMEAVGGFHYINPSGDHTTAFIRAGDVLRHSAEVDFIAMGLLPWWPDDVRHIFVDTAGISSIAYALADLRRKFDDSLVTPTIDSFSSYGGVGAFMVPRDGALCLISASISGNLQRRIVNEKGLDSRRVVTLFYGGEQSPDTDATLCDLVSRDSRQPGRTAIKRFASRATCEMCSRGNPSVQIAGDEFLPGSPEVSDHIINSDDAPRSWLTPLLRSLVGEGIVRCHGRSERDGGRVHELYLKLDGALGSEGGSFARVLRRRLVATFPVALSHIIYVQDASSKALAMAVRAHYEQAAQREIPDDCVIGDEELLRKTRDLPSADGAVVVVAGTMSSGRAVLSINQYLRNVAQRRSIAYVVGISRLPSPVESSRIVGSITWGDGPREFPLIEIAKAYLPHEGVSARSSWADEQDLWQRLEAELSGSEQAEIQRRLGELDNAQALDGEGLTHAAFLPSAAQGAMQFDDDARMRLRPGFVFWEPLPGPGGDPDQVSRGSQADVYLTIAAILHSLRSDGAKLAPIQHERRQTVLAPANFTRYNDGVIQASFLRAALPRELDYSHDPFRSGQMLDLVQRFLARRDHPEGEAAPEFLLALVLKRLVLAPADMDALCEHLEEIKEQLPPLMCVLARRLMDTHAAGSTSGTAGAAAEAAA